MKAPSEKPPLTLSWVTQLSYGMMRYDPETSAANFATSCVACYFVSRAYMKGRKSFPSRPTFWACWHPSGPSMAAPQAGVVPKAGAMPAATPSKTT